MQVGSLRPERSIPDAVLRRAKGLCILTVIKVGMMVTYKAGTGLVIARKEDGSWSSPSAVASFGVGWGAQVSIYFQQEKAVVVVMHRNVFSLF
jgi:lipid-binding SYLF domain-containing protein